MAALEEFNHLSVRFVSVQDQIDTELESSLISERVTAGMSAAETRGKHLGRPATPKRVIGESEALTPPDADEGWLNSKLARLCEFCK